MKPPIFVAASLIGLLAGCVDDFGMDEKQPKPSIAYVSLAVDTLDVPVSHAVNSSGGPVAHYAIEPALPAGLTLDSTSGLISGTPSVVSTETEYWVIATGPGGKDTAAISLEVIAAEAFVSLGLAIRQAPGYQISRVVLTWISSIGSDTVVRDTLLPGENGLSASAASDQSLLKSYSLKPRRSWKAKVSISDIKDSTLYRDSVLIPDLLVGEHRPVTFWVEPRYSTYVVQFVLPDSIRSTTSATSQVLNVNRLRTTVNGRATVDSIKASGYFAPSPSVHTLTLPYVAATGYHVFGIQVFGVIPGGSPADPLYADSLVAGPGDTTYAPSLRWTGSGSVAGLTVVVGKLNQVSFEPVLPGPILLKRNKP